MLRGLAILGTLLTNIWIFSGVASNVGDVADESARSFAAVAFQNVLALTTDGKFIGLLTIMFGIGLEIQRQSAVRRGDAWPGTYPWRAGLLILDGLLNYFFIFEFDVLMGYGSTALVVCFIMARSPRAQKIWMAIGIAAHLAHLSYMTWGSGSSPRRRWSGPPRPSMRTRRIWPRGRSWRASRAAPSPRSTRSSPD